MKFSRNGKSAHFNFPVKEKFRDFKKSSGQDFKKERSSGSSWVSRYSGVQRFWDTKKCRRFKKKLKKNK